MPPKKDDSAVLAKVGDALAIFSSFIGGRGAPRTTETAASGAGASDVYFLEKLDEAAACCLLRLEA